MELSKEEETEGFDSQAGQTWVYPTNYPLRDYQYSIIEEALLKNTLVSLPTGLGKTFIAAVVMYNFYRWYPLGKIIFMAPTRPLVKQQIDACYNVMAIPKDVTAELTGSKMQVSRKDVWKDKRVFFVTPQVLQNDLDFVAELGSKIKCLVFDEAHKAKGKHAYCEVIRKLVPKHKYFRVLALSATPGSTINDIGEVINNLLISHLALRTDDSPDVTPYVFQRSLETIVVPIGEKLQQVREDYIQVLEQYTRMLINHKVLHGNCSMLTKGKIFVTLKEYQERNRSHRGEHYNDIMRNLNICVTLYHGFELLIRHGLRSFLSFFEEHSDKPLLRSNKELQRILKDVKEYLGPPPNIEALPDGSYPEIPSTTKFGHPKFYKLCDILLAHFTNSENESSRVIVFCEYRESVMEAYALLLQQRPLIKPKIFLGQGAITQKQQVRVVQAFRKGECNTLISTCIGEEGLDVGEVDLIVCFDISNKSPIRMIQRIGRTGRKRQGRVVLLVTEGREEMTLKDCLIQKHYLSNNVLKSAELTKKLYGTNPRMVPHDILPKCQKIFITVKKNVETKNGSIKNLFDTMENSNETSMIDMTKIIDRLPVRQELWSTGFRTISNSANKDRIDFSKHVQQQRNYQSTGRVGPSKDSEILVSLLQYADSKKYNIPITQIPKLTSQFTQAPDKIVLPSASNERKNKGLKQSDIRSMFSVASQKSTVSSSQTSSAPTACETVVIEDDDIAETRVDHSDTTNWEADFEELHREIRSYLLDAVDDTCNVCKHLFDCTEYRTAPTVVKKYTHLKIPDLAILNDITLETLTLFSESLSPKSNEVLNKCDDDGIDSTFNIKDKSVAYEAPRNIGNILKKCNSSLFDNAGFTQIEDNYRRQNRGDSENAALFKNNDLTYERQQTTPINNKSLIENEQLSCDDIHDELNSRLFENAGFTQLENDYALQLKSVTRENDDTRNSSSSLTYENKHESENVLNFFKLKNLDEMFIQCDSKADISRFTPKKIPITPNSVFSLDDTIIYTPENEDASNNYFRTSTPRSQVKSDSICSNSQSEDGSPVLRSYDRGRFFKNRVTKKLFNDSCSASNSSASTVVDFQRKQETEPKNTINKVNEKGKPQLSNLFKQNSANFYVSKSAASSAIENNKKLTIVAGTDINRKKNKDETVKNTETSVDFTSLKTSDAPEKSIDQSMTESAKLDLDIDDICDLSLFMPDDTAKIKTSHENKMIEEKQSKNNKTQTCNATNKTQTKTNISNTKDENGKKQLIDTNEKDALNALLDVEDICDLSIFGFDINETTKISNGNHTADLSEFNFGTNEMIKSKKITKENETKSKLSIQKETTKIKHRTTNSLDFDFEIDDMVKSKKITKQNETKSKLSTQKDKPSTSNFGWITPKNIKKHNKLSTKGKIVKGKTQETQLSITQMLDMLNNKPTQKKVINTVLNVSPSKVITINSSDSENDFETLNRSKSKINNETARKTLLKKSKTQLSSDDDFEVPKSPLISKKPKSLQQKRSKLSCNSRKTKENPFIEYEAELSEEEGILISDDEKSFDEPLESSFVNDETQDFACTQMHARYLQSVRSPQKARSKFKIPTLPRKCPVNVYSQVVVDNVDNTYLNDSFCVGSQEHLESENEFSELELAEMLLKEERRKKKKSRSQTKGKKRRILDTSDDSD